MREEADIGIPSGRFAARIALIAGLVVVIAAGGLYANQRWVRGNFHEVVPGEVYRSAQPSPAQLRTWTREHHLAAVLNLRDDRGFHDEADAARAAGLRYVHLPFSDGNPMERPAVLALLDSLETLPRPLLIHCRSGADRAGTVSTMAQMAVGGMSFMEARDQLSARYLHFGDDPEAVEGVLLRYASYCERLGRNPGGWTEFKHWVRDHYHESYFLVDITAPDTIRTTPNTLTGVELVIRNGTDFTIPAGLPGHDLKVAAYEGSATDQIPDFEYHPRLQLTAPIAPYDSLIVTREFTSPAEPGVYEIRFDLLEENVAWFCSAGSPENIQVLVVEGP